MGDDQGYRQQINAITSFVDASNVYGSDRARADALRTFSGGRLKMSDGRLLPTGIDIPNDTGGTNNPSAFVAGDIRANENVALTSMHTLFVREHNRLAGIIEAQHPEYSDEQIYQLARKIVGAEIQKITYDEFLPALLAVRRRPRATIDTTIPSTPPSSTRLPTPPIALATACYHQRCNWLTRTVRSSTRFAYEMPFFIRNFSKTTLSALTSYCRAQFNSELKKSTSISWKMCAAFSLGIPALGVWTWRR